MINELRSFLFRFIILRVNYSLHCLCGDYGWINTYCVVDCYGMNGNHRLRAHSQFRMHPCALCGIGCTVSYSFIMYVLNSNDELWSVGVNLGSCLNPNLFSLYMFVGVQLFSRIVGNTFFT
eukprot:234143_1